MRRRNVNRQIGGRQGMRRRDGSCRFEGPGMRRDVENNGRQMFNRGFGRGICMNMDYIGDNKEFLTEQKEFLENRINCINDQLENIE